MRKPLAITAGLAVGFIALVIAVMPNFVAYRAKSPGKLTYDIAPSYDESEAPVRPNKKMMPAEPSIGLYSRRFADSRERSAPDEGEISGTDQTYVGRDRFEIINANPVKRVSEEPVSTFSIDVDTASYAFVRRALNSGVLPQKNAVRVEELINYFDYDYPLPTDKHEPFYPTVTILDTPWNSNTKLLHIGIKGLEIIPKKKPKANL